MLEVSIYLMFFIWFVLLFNYMGYEEKCVFIMIVEKEMKIKWYY